MSRKKMKLSVLCASLTLAAAMAGCGTSNKEGAISLDSVGKVGDTACFQCHGGRVTELLTGEDILVQYQKSSPHLGDAGGCESCHGGGAMHNGVGPIPFPEPGVARCQTCHDGTTAALTSAQKHETSMHANPAGTHTGNCSRCHTHEGAILGNINGVTGESNLFNAASTRGTDLRTLYNQWPGTYSTSIKCETCHEHGGGLRTVYALYSTGNGGRGSAKGLWNPSGAGAAEAKNNQFNLCTSCHNYYNYNGSRLIATGSVATGGYAMQQHATNIDTTRLRGVILSTHKEKGIPTSVTLPFLNMTSNNATNRSDAKITGYVLRKVAPTGTVSSTELGNDTWHSASKTPYTDPNFNGVCFDCHGHDAKTSDGGSSTAGFPGSNADYSTIYTDWGRSGHGGAILQAKQALNGGTAATTADKILHSYVDNAFRLALHGKPNTWGYYNWDSTLKFDQADSTVKDDRGSCQRCHTATGFANFAENPATYDPERNDFRHLVGWKQKSAIVSGSTAIRSGGSKQNEVLYCWGCHSNAGAGTLRNPGAITQTYTAGTTGDPATTVTYPDAKGSNVCISCHLGRETGEVIKNDQDADGVRSFINSHYLAAGGTLFGTTGYEFGNRDYANRASFQHDKIGTSAAPGTGSNGPCVGCHMTTPNSHKFSNVTKDGTGAITAITSTACVTCHAGNYALTPESLTVEEEEYMAALDALKAALASKGIFFANSHPYFFKDTNANGVLDSGEISSSNGFTNWASVYGFAEWKNTMGAAFNFNLLEHDPGGYAHNRYYAKRLIWDSIDFIYDGVLNDDVVAAIDAQVTAGRLDAAVADEAKTYLGTARR